MKKIFNENDECLIGSLPPLLSLSKDSNGDDEIQPFLDIIDEEDGVGDGLIPYIPSLFDNWIGFEDLSLSDTPPLDLDLINGETYAWSNLADRAKTYGYEFKGEPYKLFQAANVEETEVQAVNDEEAEFPVLHPEDMDALEELQDRNNAEEVLEIQVLDADENVKVLKKQTLREKTDYMFPPQYPGVAADYILRYENPASTAEDSVFDIPDANADLFFDADANPLYFSELNKKNEEIDANNEMEEHEVSNSEELIASTSQELTASNSNELIASNSKESNVSNDEIAETELEQG